MTANDVRQSAGGALLSRQEYTWTTSGKPYVSAVLNRIDPGQSYEKQSKTEQTLDAWGNTTLLKECNFGSNIAPETTASRVTTITYNTSQEFADRKRLRIPSIHGLRSSA